MDIIKSTLPTGTVRDYYLITATRPAGYYEKRDAFHDTIPEYRGRYVSIVWLKRKDNHKV